MTTATIAVSNQLNNHELDKLVEKMTELLILSAVQAMNSQMNHTVYKFKPSEIKAGKKKVVSYPSVASVVAERFNNLDPATRRSARLDLGRDRSTTHAIRRYGTDMRSSKSMLDQIDAKAHFSFINGTTFSKPAMQNMVSEFSSETTPIPITSVPIRTTLESDLRTMHARYGSFLRASWVDGVLGEYREREPAVDVALNKGLKFRVHEVKCIDETNPEWPGHDEIAWGGVSVDDKGDTLRIPEYYVGGGFDDGDKRTYSPPRTIRTYTIGDDVYPKTFLNTLALAEKDCGGLSAFIEALYQAIKAHIQLIMTALGAAAGAAVGQAIGGSIGTAIAGPLGTIIGIVAGAIIGALIGWLISALKDDIFEPMASSVTFNSANDTFSGGSLVSPAAYFHYRDHGGHYRIRYDWEILREA